MSAPRKIASGHHIQFSSYINRLREGAARSKYGSRIACTETVFWAMSPWLDWDARRSSHW
jgi:hypothetical protein